MEEFEEREINIKHLFFIICKKWKQIIVWALIGAIILSAYGYYKGKSIVRKINKEELVQKEINLTSQQDYLNNSVIMKNKDIDFLQQNLQVNISIKGENTDKIMKVFESYINFIQADGFYNLVANEINESPKYIYELINISNINDNRALYTLYDDSFGNRTLAFIIAISGPDVKYTSKITSILKNQIINKKEQISLSICPHSIDIFNIGQMTIKVANGNSSKIEKNIKNLKAEISATKGGNNISYKKWILLGLLAGVFISAGIFILRYVFSDKLHESEEIESIFGIKTWSTKQIKDKKIKEILIATVLTKKDDYSAILATGVAVADNLKNIVTEANKEIGEDVFILYEDIINNPDAIKALSKAKAVLLLETAERSNMSDIYREIKYIKQSNIPIIGCVVDID